jgi:hypothetical protein
MLVLAADTVATALIAAGAVVLGGALTTLGTLITARNKLAELQLVHRQQLADAHLQSARSHTETIYIPLNAALSELADAFLVLREQISEQPNTTSSTAVDSFREAIHAFLLQVRDITGGGKDAYLTADFDAGLREFTAFLRASLTATAVREKLVVEIAGALAATVPLVVGPFTGSLMRSAVKLSAGAFGFGAVAERDEVLAAPLTDRRFEQRFQRDMAALKSSIRHVTLGRPAAD